MLETFDLIVSTNPILLSLFSNYLLLVPFQPNPRTRFTFRSHAILMNINVSRFLLGQTMLQQPKHTCLQCLSRRKNMNMIAFETSEHKQFKLIFVLQSIFYCFPHALISFTMLIFISIEFSTKKSGLRKQTKCIKRRTIGARISPVAQHVTRKPDKTKKMLEPLRAIFQSAT